MIALEHAGVAFSRTDDGHIAQRRFGGHTKDFGKEPVRRAAYAADRIGHQILFSLWQQCVAEGVEFAEEWYVTDLVVSEDHGKVEGVVAFDTHKGETHAIHARNVLMATGGAGRLFHTTSNSWDLCSSIRPVSPIPAFCCLRRHVRKAACCATPMARRSWNITRRGMPILPRVMW